MRDRPTLTAWRSKGEGSIPFGGIEINRIPQGDRAVPPFVYEAVEFQTNDAGSGFAIRDLRHAGQHITANSLLRSAIQAICTCAGEGEEAFDRARQRLVTFAEQILPRGQICARTSFAQYADREWREARPTGDKVARVASALLYGLNKGDEGESVHEAGKEPGARGERDAILAISEIRKEIRGEEGKRPCAADGTTRCNTDDDRFIQRVASAAEVLLDYNSDDGEPRYLHAVCVRHLVVTSVAAGLDALPQDQRENIARHFMEVFIHEQGWSDYLKEDKKIDDPQVPKEEESDEERDKINKSELINGIMRVYNEKMHAIEAVFGHTQGYGYHHALAAARGAGAAPAAAAGAVDAPVALPIAEADIPLHGAAPTPVAEDLSLGLKTKEPSVQPTVFASVAGGAAPNKELSHGTADVVALSAVATPHAASAAIANVITSEGERATAHAVGATGAPDSPAPAPREKRRRETEPPSHAPAPAAAANLLTGQTVELAGEADTWVASTAQPGEQDRASGTQSR